MSFSLQKWTCQLSEDEIYEFLEKSRKVRKSVGFEQDAYDAAVEILFNKFKELGSFDIDIISNHEHKLRLFNENDLLGTAVISVKSEGEVDITVEFKRGLINR
jgi:hypothetical protein